jgi:hypothetical protein
MGQLLNQHTGGRWHIHVCRGFWAAVSKKLLSANKILLIFFPTWSCISNHTWGFPFVFGKSGIFSLSTYSLQRRQSMKGQLLPQFCKSLQVNSETAVMAQLSHSSADATVQLPWPGTCLCPCLAIEKHHNLIAKHAQNFNSKILS